MGVVIDMRLIDADALKESIRCSDTDEPKVLSPKQLHKVLTEWIDKRPTIEERKTGKWIGHPINEESRSMDKDTCSNCATRFYQIAETGCVWNFCPNCGADMKEGDPE